MLSAGQISVRFRQILDKQFLPKRIKLALIKKLYFLSTLVPYLKDPAHRPVVIPTVISILYVHTHITSC